MHHTCHVWLQLYHTLGVYLVLVGVEVWTSGDLIVVDAGDYSQTLAEFCDYRTNYINSYRNNDNAHLITYAHVLLIDCWAHSMGP